MSTGTAELDLRPEFSTVTLSGLSNYAAQPAAYSAGMLRSIFKRPLPRARLDALITQAQRTPLAVGAAMLVADVFGVDRQPALQKIDVPALVIASAGSTLLDAQQAIAAAIDGARLLLVPNARHALFVDDPATFDAALGQLFKAADATRSR